MTTPSLPRFLILAMILAGTARGQGWVDLPIGTPTTAIVFDQARHGLLLAGTDSQQRLYEWDGTTVRERLGDLALEKVVQHLVYDRAQQEVLALSNDRYVGTWSGGGWTWRKAGTPPPVDVTTSMTFDELRRRLVVLTDGGAVYEWDGVRWWATGQAPAGVSGGAAFAFDPNSHHCILYGGTSFASAETWAWNGFAWTQLSPTSAPGARQRAGLALDPSGPRLVLYGGTTANDTWVWNGTTWSQLATTNDPGPQTTPRLVADDTGVTMVAFEDPTGLEIWQLRGTTWVRSGVLPAYPAWRTNAARAYDPVRGVIVGFGGDQFGLAVPPEQTTLFDRRWLHCNPATNPPLRHSAQLAWSPPDQKVLLFGGVYQGSILRGDTWLWNGTDWEPRQPAASPPARYGAAMTQDPLGGVMLFGGFDGTTYLGDQWHWDGTNWLPQTPATAPLPRAFPGKAYNPAQNQVMLAGGYSNLGAYGNETWLWDGVAWTQSPSQTFVNTQLVYWPATGHILSTGLNASYEWSGTAWISRPELRIPAYYAPAAHLGRGQLLIFSAGAASIFSPLAANAEAFGSSCAFGPAPALTPLTRPTPDSSFAIEVTARAAMAPTFLVLGLAAQNAPLGAGCRAAVGMQLGITFALANANGIAHFPIAIPNDSDLVGVQFTNQGVVWDPAHSPLGTVTLTAGLRITIGD